MRILVVEDEPRIAGVVVKGLREQGYAVDLASDGEEGLDKAFINAYEVVVLDILLPKLDGISICRELRKLGSKTPILMLTAKDAVEDRVAGLESGADDYLSKPFDFKELLARVRALCRRGQEFRPEVLKIGDLEINTASHVVTRGGRELSLTAKEYALLEFFALRSGRLVTRREIAEHVWDEHFESLSNVIDVFVRRLRRKIDDDFVLPLIHTRRGEGYILSATIEPGDDQ